MKIFILFLVIWIISLQSLLASKFKLSQIRTLDKKYEISGLEVFQNKILTVLDDETDHYIFEVKQKGNSKEFQLVPFINLSQLNGFRKYHDEINLLKNELGDSYLLWDLEALSVCNNDIYLINERFRHVLKVDTLNKSIEKININFNYWNKVFGLKFDFHMQGGPNAGFEALAVNCETKDLFIIKERNERMIYHYNLKMEKMINIFDVPFDTTYARKGMLKGKLIDLSEDYSDAFYFNDNLYLLERNSYTIVKINPYNQKIIERISFSGKDQEFVQLADSGEPFGMSEGLLIYNNQLILGFDTNQFDLNSKGMKLIGKDNKDKNLILIFNFD